MLEYLSFIIIILYTIYLCRRAIAFNNSLILKENLNTQIKTTVSIIIPARNEEQYIHQCLVSISNQTYKNFEIIVIDDNSTDNTSKIVHDFIQKRKDISIRLFKITTESGNAQKKQALTLGIDKSKGEIILTTDADTYAEPEWVQTMLNYFEPDIELVAGPVRFETVEPLDYLIGLQALELAGFVALAGGAIALKQAELCNGANLAYRKQTFGRLNGFKGIDQLASGDDLLFMQKLSAENKIKFPIRFAADKRALVTTYPCYDYTSLKQQRLRWASKTAAYPNSNVKIELTIAYLANLLLLIWGIVCIFNFESIYFFILYISIKIVAEFWILRVGTRFVQQEYLLKQFLVSFLIYPIYVSWAGFVSLIKREYKWKGRIAK